MATASLKFVGPSGSLDNIDVGYIIDGATDYNDARATMMAEAAPILGSFVPLNFKLDPYDGSDSLYEGTITYGPRTTNSPDGQNEPNYSFELGVQSTKVLTSLETVGSYSSLFIDPPLDFKRAINVQDDFSVEGVDLNFPVYSWNETHYLPYSFVSRAYFVTLFNLTAKMNIAPFRDFARGEVLFMGVSGSKRYSAQDWELNYKFIASPNVENLQVGPDITVTSKLGHDYLWATYRAGVSETGTGIAKVPRHVFVERVYQFEDYGRLKLRNPIFG